MEEVFDSIVSRRTDSKNERKGYVVGAADYAYPTLTSTDFEPTLTTVKTYDTYCLIQQGISPLIH